jgi:hypothetical protein
VRKGQRARAAYTVQQRRVRRRVRGRVAAAARRRGGGRGAQRGRRPPHPRLSRLPSRSGVSYGSRSLPRFRTASTRSGAQPGVTLRRHRRAAGASLATQLPPQRSIGGSCTRMAS